MRLRSGHKLIAISLLRQTATVPSSFGGATAGYKSPRAAMLTTWLPPITR